MNILFCNTLHYLLPISSLNRVNQYDKDFAYYAQCGALEINMFIVHLIYAYPLCLIWPCSGSKYIEPIDYPSS